MTKMLPDNASLKQISETLENIKTTLSSELNRFQLTLENKGCYVWDSSLTTMINTVENELSQGYNTPPVIESFEVVEYGATYAILKYKVTDEQSQIVRHLLTVRQDDQWIVDYKDITREVGYEASSEDNGYFFYEISGLAPNTSTDITIAVSDGVQQVEQSISIFTETDLIYGIEVDETNPNPETSVKYIKDALGFTPASGSDIGSWKNVPMIKNIKQCGFKNLKVFKYLNPMNETLYADGTKVGEDVDIMTQFPKIYWKWTNTPTGYTIEVAPKKPTGTKGQGFDCPAHKKGNKEFPHCYFSCYPGCVISDSRGNKKIRSIYNKPYVRDSYTPAQIRSFIKATNANYMATPYSIWKLIQILFLLMYKSRDSQSALGFGPVLNAYDILNTGTLFDKGMYWGDKTNKDRQCKFLGIENLWGGNTRILIDGIFVNSNREILISNNSVFNDTGANYKNTHQKGMYATSNDFVFASKVIGGELGFIAKEGYGSDSTHYCDSTRSSTASTYNFICAYDGVYDDRSPGIFALKVKDLSPDSYESVSTAFIAHIGN